MKVLHLATSISGGAGIAATRLHEALLQNTIDSRIVSRDNEYKSLFTPADRFKSSALTFVQSNFLQNSADLMTPLSFDYSSKIRKLILDADIIHVHSTYNFVTLPALQELLPESKLIVITLHDQRILTGGCHYWGDCQRYDKGCKGCPKTTFLGKAPVQLSRKHYSETLKKFRKLVYISPSHWMETQLLKSLNVNESSSYVVTNPIPEKFFCPEKPELQDSDVKRVTFLAADLNNPLKNLSLIKESLKFFSATQLANIHLTLIGGGEVLGFPPSIRLEVLGRLNESEISQVLRRSDVVLVPSIQDNSPNVVGEAISSGCYVIGSTAGGIPELLSDFDMPTCNPYDPYSLYVEILKAPFRRHLERNINLVTEKFGYETASDRVVEIYNENL